MPASPTPRPWNPDDMLRAIEAFEQTGDPAPILDQLGVTADRNPLLALQHALKSAGNRRERDAFEDAALACSVGARDRSQTPPDLPGLLDRVRAEYGDLAASCLPADTVRALVRGLWQVCTPPPPLDCLLAILGIEIENAVGDTVHIDPRSFGETRTYYRTHCEQCGGEESGRGEIICPACLERVLAKLKPLFPAEKITLPDGTSLDLQTMAQHVLREEKKDHGCARCGHHPVRPCRCARELHVPAAPRDGEVALGRELASGREHRFCLRVGEGD